MEGLRIVDELSVIKDKLTLDTLFMRTSKKVQTLPVKKTRFSALSTARMIVSTIV